MIKSDNSSSYGDPLLYRPDMSAVRRRLEHWWNGGDIGRPVLQIYARRHIPHEEIPARPEPENWLTRYSTRDFDYRVNLGIRECLYTDYFGEAVPATAPDLAPNCLALYLGCSGVERPGTVWCEPCIKQPESAVFQYDPANFYWNFTLKLTEQFQQLAPGKQLIQFPDLIEGLDTLAAMRGTQELLVDLLQNPEWVWDALATVTDLYFVYYDKLYAEMKDETGGSVFWAWAPGRMSKLQCDFSAMISPQMFNDFMLPVLQKMTARFDHCMYHWDGPQAIRHHDLLLSLPDLDMLQWTPGAGAEPACHSRWWPLFHKTVDAGKKINIGCETLDELRALQREFGPKLHQFLINMHVSSAAAAEQILAAAER